MHLNWAALPGLLHTLAYSSTPGRGKTTITLSVLHISNPRQGALFSGRPPSFVEGAVLLEQLVAGLLGPERVQVRLPPPQLWPPVLQHHLLLALV